LPIGLIDEIVIQDKLMQQCGALAKRIASKHPLALTIAKRCMVKAQQDSLEDGLKRQEGILADFGGQSIRMKL
jgi:enoyl-CoA hydratase/carnithine racemase